MTPDAASTDTDALAVEILGFKRMSLNKIVFSPCTSSGAVTPEIVKVSELLNAYSGVDRVESIVYASVGLDNETIKARGNGGSPIIWPDEAITSKSSKPAHQLPVHCMRLVHGLGAKES